MTVPLVPTPLSVGITAEFMRRQAPELARDIVCQLDGAANLASSYGLAPEQWAVLRTWPAFKEMVRTAQEELGGPSGAAERARRKAALAVDAFGITDMATIMGNPKAADKDRIAAFKELREVGAIDGKNALAAAQAGLAGPLVVINLGDGKQLSVGVEPIEGEVTSRG